MITDSGNSGGAASASGSGASVKHKLVLLGDPSVGKTSIITRFMYDTFEPQYQATIGIDFFLKTVRLESYSVVLHAWDTAGQERYRSLMPNYIRNSAAAVVVYDVTSRASFLSAFTWINEVRELCGDSVVIMLAGNKSDADADKKEVSADEAKRKATEYRALWMEVSAKEGSNIKAMFRDVAKALPPPRETEEVSPGGAQAGATSSGSGGQFGVSRDPFLVTPSGVATNTSNRVNLAEPATATNANAAGSGGGGCC